METMKKSEYLDYFFQNSLYVDLRVIISVMSIALFDDEEPYVLMREGKTVWFKDEAGVKYTITDASDKAPVFNAWDEVEVTKDTMANVAKKEKTLFGIALVNAVVFAENCGDKIPFISGEIKDKQITKLLEDAFMKEEITPEELLAATQAVYWLPGLMQLCVPSATPKTLIADKSIRTHRDKVIRENPEKMKDATFVSKLEGELEQMDKDYLKDDPSMIFYIKEGKSFGVTRKRMFVMHGQEASIEGGNKLVTIPTSLEEGLNLDYWTQFNNSLRDGILKRGKETQLGGEIVKFLLRVFQGTVIAEDDCGTKIGWKVELKPEVERYLPGTYYLEGGKTKPVTPDVISKYRGKSITLRNPGYCQTGKNNFCAKCMGDKASQAPNSPSVLSVQLGSVFLGMFMSAMHGKSIKTGHYSIV